MGESKGSVEEMDLNQEFWKEKKILITGNSGFKGSWMTLLLYQLGAHIYGISDSSVPSNNIWPEIRSDLVDNRRLTHVELDIRDLERLKAQVKKIRPDMILHMAAQPLVIKSYLNPVETWQVNLDGTINILAAAEELEYRCSIVVVTTDKVYSSKATRTIFEESDELGGIDPYSASKAAVELATICWRESIFNRKASQPNSGSKVLVSTARAGNVIGGGDISKNRLIPDVIRSLQNKSQLIIRNPLSVRPWQHVVEPLVGYLKLLELQYRDDSFECGAFNFGPRPDANVTVLDLVKQAYSLWGNELDFVFEEPRFREENFLAINSQKAKDSLGWIPMLGAEAAIEMTVTWHKDKEDGMSAKLLCLNQIQAYLSMM